MKNQDSNESKLSFLDRNAFAVMMCLLGGIVLLAAAWWVYDKHFKVKEAVVEEVKFTNGDPKKQTMATFDLTSKDTKLGKSYYQEVKTFNKKIEKVRVDSSMITFISYPDTLNNVITVNEFVVDFKGIPYKLRNFNEKGNSITLDYTKEAAEVTFKQKNKSAITFGAVVNVDGSKNNCTTKVEVSKDGKTRTLTVVPPVPPKVKK